MIIHIQVFPSAETEADCTEDNMVYQAYAHSFENAEGHLGSMQRIIEKEV